MYYLLNVMLFSALIFSGWYEEGEYVSEEHQNLIKETCYAGNGYFNGDSWKLADWNGVLNGGNYNVIFITMSASWCEPCLIEHTGPVGEAHHNYTDNEHVKFLIAFSDPNQPYSCQDWGEIPDGGSSQIILDEQPKIFLLFHSGGAFPSTAFINHEMQVYDLMNEFDSWVIDRNISNMLEECGSDCTSDSCSNIYEGDINSDNIINVVDVIVMIQYILGSDISVECIPDINQDGIVDVTDIIILLNIILD